MKEQIIAIGGGAISKDTEDYPIEKYILQQTHKDNPKITFVPSGFISTEEPLVFFMSFDPSGFIWIKLPSSS